MTVRVTLEVGTWVFNALLNVVDIYATLFKNSSMHKKVTVQTQMCVPLNTSYENVKLSNNCKCDLDL
jgi:hypothetical protein